MSKETSISIQKLIRAVNSLKLNKDYINRIIQAIEQSPSDLISSLALNLDKFLNSNILEQTEMYGQIGENGLNIIIIEAGLESALNGYRIMILNELVRINFDDNQ